MPGPGFDLGGEEEFAELAEVIRSGRLSRFGPDDGTFPAKVRIGRQCRQQCPLPGPDRARHRPGRRGHRAGLHLRGDAEVAQRQAECFRSAYLRHLT